MLLYLNYTLIRMIFFITIENWTQNRLNTRAKTIKPLERDIGVNFHDLGFGNWFLDMTSKTLAAKEKK